VNRKADLTAIFEAGLAAVKTDQALERQLSLDGETLAVRGERLDLSGFERIAVVGAGKACATMAKALRRLLGDRLSGGLIAVKYGHGLALDGVEIIEAGHPVPDDNSLEAGRRILDLVGLLGDDDLLFCLITGGSSALMEWPVDGMRFDDLRRVNECLLASGATIQEMNALRRHLSAIKGGRLAKACQGRVLSLIVSDVIGDDPSVIGSGPTAPDASTHADCLDIVRKYRLAGDCPAAVLRLLESGVAGEIPETPDAVDPAWLRTTNHVIATNEAAVTAAAHEAGRRGYAPVILSTTQQGEARDVGTELVRLGLERQATLGGSRPLCLLAGGETTVTMQHSGKGGRNQEMALSMALALDGTSGVHALCAGTDGTDGPTDAAGAYAFGDSLSRAEAIGLDLPIHLEQHDAYPAFQALGDLLITGPTLTNVMDLTLLLVEEAQAHGS